jgi:hypothetical protein
MINILHDVLTLRICACYLMTVTIIITSIILSIPCYIIAVLAPHVWQLCNT